MLQIYKYSIASEGCFNIDLPKGAEILTVQAQDNEPQIWVLVNPDNPTERRRFISMATGGRFLEDRKSLIYIGTFQLYGGHYIGHLFELK